MTRGCCLAVSGMYCTCTMYTNFHFKGIYKCTMYMYTRWQIHVHVCTAHMLQYPDYMYMYVQHTFQYPDYMYMYMYVQHTCFNTPITCTCTFLFTIHVAHLQDVGVVYTDQRSPLLESCSGRVAGGAATTASTELSSSSSSSLSSAFSTSWTRGGRGGRGGVKWLL